MFIFPLGVPEIRIFTRRNPEWLNDTDNKWTGSRGVRQGERYDAGDHSLPHRGGRVSRYCRNVSTQGPSYNEFGHNKHPALAIRFVCIKIIDCNLKKFDCEEHPLTMSKLIFVRAPSVNLLIEA